MVSPYGVLFVTAMSSTVYSHFDLPFEYYSTCIDGRLACYEIQCSFADCLNSYIPEGACCPMCPPTEVEGG